MPDPPHGQTELPGRANSLTAERGRSVSGLVADYLRSLSQQMDEFARLENQQREVQAQIGRFRARDRLDRDDLHGRAVR